LGECRIMAWRYHIESQWRKGAIEGCSFEGTEASRL
jgi:hypothetical protein